MEENKKQNETPEYNPFQIKPDVTPITPNLDIKIPEIKAVEVKPEIITPEIKKPETKDEFVVFGANKDSIPESKPADIKKIIESVKIPEFKWEPKTDKSIENQDSLQTGGVEFLNDEGAKQTPAPQQLATNRIIRTFEADISQAMKEKKGSAIKIALAESKRRSGESFFEEELPKKNILLLFLAGVLIISGFSALGYVYISKKPETPNIVNGVEINSIIPAEKHDEIPTAGLTQSILIKTMMDEMSNYNMRLDTILDVYFTEVVAGKKQKAGTAKFFEALGSRIPQVLLRSLQENFMLGIHSFNGNQPFLILKTDFYENAFLGLLKWEGDMPADLLPLFGTRITPENSYLIGKQFIDSTYKNKDVRILLDNENRVVLIYAIPNRQTIIITSNEDTLDEVINRLNAPSAITQ